jgi:hypothetical protein
MDVGEVRDELDALGRDGFVAKHGRFFLVFTDEAALGDFADFVNTATRDANEIASKGGLDQADVQPIRPIRAGEEQVSVGREADVSIQHRKVSKVHAWFSVTGGLLQLADAGSKNGTWLNGRALKPHQWVPVDVGDTINLGSLSATVWGIDDLMAAVQKK